MAAVAIAGCFDHRTVTGINPWIKPAKFYITSTIFLWTVAWYLAGLRGKKPWLRWGFAVTMLIENFFVTMQAARGVASHFNVSTAFDAAVFSTMGAIILLNTLFLVCLLILFFQRPRNLAPSYLWGIRLGLLLTILGSMEGGVMVARLSHTVGLADGGPGLPLIYWSTKGGDLRVAHFLGIHGMQVIPLFGWWTQGRSAIGVGIFAAAYAGVTFLLFRMAMSGVPLVASTF
jgi:hypothetical protein